MFQIRAFFRSLLVGATADVVAREFIDYVIEQRLAEIARLQAAAAAQGITNVQDLVAAQFTLVDSLLLLEPVVVPSRPIDRGTRQSVLVGVVLGALLAMGGALLLYNLQDTVRNPDEVHERFGVTVLGTVFKWSPQFVEDNELIVWKAPTSGFSESFRQMRANLQFATANKPGQVYMITSPGPEEGKSTIICNLAVALAQSGKRVVIVDGDLRRPSVHSRFQPTTREPGLSNYLGDDSVELSDVLYATQADGISIIPGGPIPPNPSELLGSPRMGTLLEATKQEADIVLVDSPPILLVADGSILAAQMDGVVTVVDGSKTRSGSLSAALDTLRSTQVDLVGLVINKMKRVRFGYAYGYGYPYYYKYSDYYYTYYSSPDSDQGTTNGRGPLYRRPVEWVSSVFSRFQSPKRRS